MGRTPWTTPAQAQWLAARLPIYIKTMKTQGAARDRTFLKRTYEAWFQQWPAREPGRRDLKKAGGDEDVARRNVILEARDVSNTCRGYD